MLCITSLIILLPHLHSSSFKSHTSQIPLSTTLYSILQRKCHRWEKNCINSQNLISLYANVSFFSFITIKKPLFLLPRTNSLTPVLISTCPYLPNNNQFILIIISPFYQLFISILKCPKSLKHHSHYLTYCFMKRKTY